MREVWINVYEGHPLTCNYQVAIQECRPGNAFYSTKEEAGAQAARSHSAKEWVCLGAFPLFVPIESENIAS